MKEDGPVAGKIDDIIIVDVKERVHFVSGICEGQSRTNIDKVVVWYLLISALEGQPSLYHDNIFAQSTRRCKMNRRPTVARLPF